MIEALPILNPQTLPDIHNVTFSAAYSAGLTHYDWLDGRKIDPVGRDRALVSHSALPEKERGLQTSGTFGPLFAGLSLSADLQRSLENRLRQRMEGLGSPEYELTWKQWDIGSEPPICAQRASGRRISGKDCGGWQSPNVVDATGRQYTYPSGDHTKPFLCLPGQAQAAGWVTPQAKDFRSGQEKRWSEKIHAVSLNDQVTVAGWKTPHASDGEGGVMEIREGTAGHYKLRDTAHLAGRPTVTAQDAENNAGPSQFSRNSLPLNTAVVAWTSSGPSGGPAGMENIGEFLPDGWKMPENGKLNPRFSLWLMGYPEEWAFSGERVTR
jgi:hypothetical protein